MGVCALTHTLAHALHKMLPPSPPWPEVNSKAYDSHYGQAHGKERERKKRKKKAHNNAHTASQAMDVLPLGNAGASARCTSLPDVDGGAPAATPYTPRHTLHISKILPNSGGTRYRQTGTATIAQTTFYSWSLPGSVCTVYTGLQ